jgi:hypothetical protein
VLEGIDDIDWSVLEHAYGPATDVPDLVRALVAPDAVERQKALHTLYGSIVHQGTRYEATAYAVPFLLELVADPATPGRPELLRLLALLAIGYDEQWLPGTFPVAEQRAAAAGGAELLRAAPPIAEDDLDDEGEDVDDEGEDEGVEDRYSYYDALSEDDANAVYTHVAIAAYDAVRAGAPLLRSLVAGDDRVLRRAAAYVLAWFPEDAADGIAALAPATTAGDSDRDGDTESQATAATALVAVGLLARGADADLVARATTTAEAALAGEAELLRWGAAVALAALQGPAAGREVVAELLTWAGGPAQPRDDIPFLGGDVGGLAALALRHLGDAHAEVTFDALLGRLRRVSGVPAVTVLAEALRRAWPDGPPPAVDTPFATLTDPQQRLLGLLAESPGTWRYGDYPLFGNFTSLLFAHNLPRDVTQMRAYVGP